MTTLEFFFDCSSPWTYLGFHNVQPLAREMGLEIDWRPILVGGIFNTSNPSAYYNRANMVPAKDVWHGKDLADWARFTGLRIKWRPSVFPVNSAGAMRGCIFADRFGKLPEHARMVFDAYWGDDRDIAGRDVLEEIAGKCGLDVKAYLEAIESPGLKQKLRENTDELIARGGFGSPTIFVNRDDMYFGNDRLVLVKDALQRAK